MSTKLLNIVERIKQITGKPAISYQGGYLCYCPGHGDKDKPSLSVSDPGDKIFLNCFVRSGNCSFHQLVEIIGIPESEYYHNYEEYKKEKREENNKLRAQNPTRKKKNSTEYKQDNLDFSTQDNNPYNSKKEYRNLADYASFKAIPEQIFIDAGWSNDFKNKIKCIKITTDGGNRYRLLNNGNNKFLCDTEPKFERCWYKLDQAIELSNKYEQSLILCNGEPSTVVGQYRGLAVFALCGSESNNFTEVLIEQLKGKYQGSILIPIDNDSAGKASGKKRLETLKNAGFHIRLIELNNIYQGYDLADFCKDNQGLEPEQLYKKLIELPTFNPDQQTEVKQITEILTKDLTEEEKALLPANFSDLFDMFKTDVGTSYRFVMQHGHYVKYCHPWKQWLFWDGKKWVEDKIGEIFRRGLLTVESLIQIWLEMPENTKEEKFAKKVFGTYVRELQGRGKLKNFLEIAKNAPSIYILPDQFDENHYILNCQNGILDLKTGQLRPHNPKDYLSKIVTAEYHEKAECPIWLNFLKTIMNGNQNLIDYLQVAIGHSLTGNTMEKALFFLYGAEGNNGKSTFLETISGLLGSYALAKFPMNALLEDQYNNISSNPSPYIAQLCGVRFVSGSELSGNKKLNEETVKDLTGGIDTIVAKRLYQDPFNFKPTHKLFMFGNEKPYIPRNSNAVWNRLKTIPFVISISFDKQDRNLPDKLLLEKEGILNWAVEGCLKWQHLGLGIPDEIQAANDAYRDEMDQVGAFIAEECIIDKLATVSVKDLYLTYSRWCKESNVFPQGKMKFNKEIKAQKWKLETGSGAHNIVEWKGIKLKPNIELELLQQKTKAYLKIIN